MSRGSQNLSVSRKIAANLHAGWNFISRAPWINFNLLADCRKLNDDKLVEDPGNCPLASDITNAIEADPTIHGDAGAHVQAMVKILDWAQEEGLLVGNRGLTVCENCLGLLYKQTPECMQVRLKLDLEG